MDETERIKVTTFQKDPSYLLLLATNSSLRETNHRFHLCKHVNYATVSLQ